MKISRNKKRAASDWKTGATFFLLLFQLCEPGSVSYTAGKRALRRRSVAVSKYIILLWQRVKKD